MPLPIIPGGPVLLPLCSAPLVSIPLVPAMVLVFAEFGVPGALIFCVLTELGAALFMKEISAEAGIETIVIAVFVFIGVKVAPLISKVFT